MQTEGADGVVLGDFTPVRRCSNCFRWKQTDQFYVKRHKMYKGGVTYQSRCKPCNYEVVRAYVKRAREKEKREAWNRVWERKEANRC